MTLPPLWKVFRELDRVKQVGLAVLAKAYEPMLQRRHDQSRDAILDVSNGRIPLGRKIALLLVFQPSGISQTLLVTCRHLMSKGYASLVVSNAPISTEDRERLAEVTWKIIVRPNFGYDFGGYRDGILWLADRGIVPDRLLILNDSIWFPVWPDETLIDRMEAMPVDLAGAVSHPSQRRRMKSGHRPAFVESYFYLANRSALESRAFTVFWRGFRVSSIKHNAIHRGERRFSTFLKESGLTVRGVISIDAMIEAIKARDDAYLAKVLAYGVYTDQDLAVDRDQLLAADLAGHGWRARALAHVVTTMHRHGAYSSFPLAAFLELGVPFIKKSKLTIGGRVRPTHQAVLRNQVLRAVETGDLPAPEPAMLAEIASWEAHDR